MDKPLQNWRIINTRPEHQSSHFSQSLLELGAEVIERPMILITPPEDPRQFDDCLQNLNSYDWVVFSSANAVRTFADRFAKFEFNTYDFQGLKFAGVGSSTVESMARNGFKAEFVPEEFTAEDFVVEFTAKYTDLRNLKALFPAGNIARDMIPEGLRKAEMSVDQVTVYRTSNPIYRSNELLNDLKPFEKTVVTFTSSSAVDGFFGQFKEEQLKQIKNKLIIASIGPKTSETIMYYDAKPEIEATQYSSQGLIESIKKYVNNKDQK